MAHDDQILAPDLTGVAERLREILAGPGFPEELAALRHVPIRRALAALSTPLCQGETEFRWRAAAAVGLLIAELAGRDREAAANVVRRLMWNLNEESGNCAWGAAEAMGEALRRDPALAEDFAHVLVAYIIPEGSFLEFEPLLRGALWGIGRVAERRPKPVRHAAPYLAALLDSPDPGVRGLAALALGWVGGPNDRAALAKLFPDQAEFENFDGRSVTIMTVADAARAAALRLPPG